MRLPDFKSEEEFRQWLVRFFIRMGYHAVRHYHGEHEQGKDLYFADFDRLGYRRLYATQAKHGPIGAGDRALNDLFNQVERAFDVPVRYEKTVGGEQRVSGVYVSASGTISARAKEFISDRCRGRSYGENVFFLGGEELAQLDRAPVIRERDAIQTALSGLFYEATHNRLWLAKARKSIEGAGQVLPVGRCRLTGMEAVLTRPLPESILKFDVVENAWRHTQGVNTLLGYVSQTTIVGTRPVDAFFKRAHLFEHIDEADEAVTDLAVEADSGGAKLDRMLSDGEDGAPSWASPGSPNVSR